MLIASYYTYFIHKKALHCISHQSDDPQLHQKMAAHLINRAFKKKYDF